MTALYIILGIFLVIAILLFIPVKLFLRLNMDNAQVRIEYAFYKRILYPKSEEEIESESSNKAQNEETSPNKEKFIQLIKTEHKSILQLLKIETEYILKHGVVINDLNISGQIGTGDPMYTGIVWGGVSAVIYNAAAALYRYGKLKNKDINISPNFEEMTFCAGVYIQIRTNIWHMIVMVVKALPIGIKIYKKYKNINIKN